MAKVALFFEHERTGHCEAIGWLSDEVFADPAVQDALENAAKRVRMLLTESESEDASPDSQTLQGAGSYRFCEVRGNITCEDAEHGRVRVLDVPDYEGNPEQRALGRFVVASCNGYAKQALESIAAMPLWGEALTEGQLSLFDPREHELEDGLYHPSIDTESEHYNSAVLEARKALGIKESGAANG